MEEIIKEIEDHLRSIGLTPLTHHVYPVGSNDPSDRHKAFVSFTVKDKDDYYQTLVAGCNLELGCFNLYAHVD